MNIQDVENLLLGDTTTGTGIDFPGFRSSKSKRRAIRRKLKRIQKQADRAFKDVKDSDSGFLDDDCDSEM